MRRATVRRVLLPVQLGRLQGQRHARHRYRPAQRRCGPVPLLLLLLLLLFLCPVRRCDGRQQYAVHIFVRWLALLLLLLLLRRRRLLLLSVVVVVAEAVAGGHGTLPDRVR